MIVQNSSKGVTLSIQLQGEDHKKHLTILQGSEYIKMPIYTPLDSPVAGDVIVTLDEGTTLEHKGIYIELYGRLEEKKNDTKYYFLQGRIDLDRAKTLNRSNKFWFQFQDFPKQPESCYGINGKIRYYVKATINRGSRSDIWVEKDFAVYSYVDNRLRNAGNEMNLGQQDKIHINYKQDKISYDLNDMITAKITITQQQKIKDLNVSFGRKEKLFSLNITSWIKNVTEDNLEEFNLTHKCLNEGGKQVIWLKIPLSNYRLSPSCTFQTNTALYFLGFFIKIKVSGEDGFTASEDLRLELWRKVPDDLKKKEEEMIARQPQPQPQPQTQPQTQQQLRPQQMFTGQVQPQGQAGPRQPEVQ